MSVAILFPTPYIFTRVLRASRQGARRIFLSFVHSLLSLYQAIAGCPLAMRSHGATPWFAVAAFQLACLVAGQLSDAPSANNLVRRFSGAGLPPLCYPSMAVRSPCYTVVVLGNYAYLDGGEVIQMDGGRMSTARIGTGQLDETRQWKEVKG